PAGRGKADVVALHVRLKRRANRFDHARAGRVVFLLQHAANRTEARQVRNQRLFRQAAGNVDWLDVDTGPPASLQNALDILAVCEGELPGRTSLARSKVWQERRRSTLRRRHERVFLGTSPDEETEPGVVRRRTPQVGKSPDRVVEKHHAEPR